MNERKIQSTDKKNNLHVYTWEPEGKIEAILQISHGMKEYIGRYTEFAEYLASKNILVIGNDHLGHGLTAKDDRDLGYFGPGKSKTVVDDLYEVTKYAKEKYGKEIPYFLFGHSMGSFMARRYLMTYGDELAGAVISGTGSQPPVVLAGGRFIAFVTGIIKGERYKSEFIKNLAFGAYLKKIENPKTDEDWLCKDDEIIERYRNDKFCMFDFTVNGYKTLFDSIAFIQNKKNIEKIPKTLPVIFISGSEDPVGNYGQGVEKAYNDFEKAGIENSEMVLYHGGRHEMLNETEREGVYDDVYTWIKDHI